MKEPDLGKRERKSEETYSSIPDDQPARLTYQVAYSEHIML